ncbi:MAG: CIA30 family protein, partial [Hyphomicrobiales bacterium]
FTAHRTEIPLDLRRLRRLGLVAIGRAFAADLALAHLRLV